MKEQNCVQTREVNLNKMSIKICTMLDSCKCGSLNCCSKNKITENGTI